MKVGYVVSHYPSVSHTFVLREVIGLRRDGVEVPTFSVHQAAAEDMLSAADRDERKTTEALLPTSAWRLLRCHARAVLTSPTGYLRTLAAAIQRGPRGLKRSTWQLFYFAEAMILWDRADRAGVRHLHAHLTNVASDVAWLASTFGNHAEPGGWTWSMTVHGPTEFFNVRDANLANKVRGSDLVVCISNFCRSQLMSLVASEHWPKLVIVHCGVDLERYSFRPPKRMASDPLRILCVGRLVPEKGQRLLLAAVKHLREEGIDASVTFVGGGVDEGSLHDQREREGLRPEEACFTGPVGQDELPSLFREHDAFCLPSFAEGVPVAIMEAMASGLPVVATQIAGISELVANGRSGFLVAPGSVEDLVSALRQIARDVAESERMAHIARTKVVEDFDAWKSAQLLAAVFRGLRAETCA